MKTLNWPPAALGIQTQVLTMACKGLRFSLLTTPDLLLSGTVLCGAREPWYVLFPLLGTCFTLPLLSPFH